MPCSALVRPCQFWVLQYKNSISELKRVHQKVPCSLWGGAPSLGDQTEAVELVHAGEKAVLRGTKSFASTNKKIDNIGGAWWYNERQRTGTETREFSSGSKEKNEDSQILE